MEWMLQDKRYDSASRRTATGRIGLYDDRGEYVDADQICACSTTT